MSKKNVFFDKLKPKFKTLLEINQQPSNNAAIKETGQTYKKCDVCGKVLNIKSFTRHSRTHLVENNKRKRQDKDVDTVVRKRSQIQN